MTQPPAPSSPPSASPNNTVAPSTTPGPTVRASADTVPCTLSEFLLYFVKLGTFGFGGPIALAGYMQRDLVERHRWVSLQEYKEGLALAQLMPGPLAAQLAIYLGWVKAGVLGATLVSLAFVMPSFLMVLVLSAIYVAYGGLSWMQGAFYGIGAAVIAIIGRSAWKLVKTTMGQDRLLWVVLGISALTTAITETEVVWAFLLSGVVVMWVKAPPGAARKTGLSVVPLPVGLLPAGLLSGLTGPATGATLWQILGFFTSAGAVVFGSGLAIVPFLYGGVVEQYHWLTERQFLDAVAVAMITPGPVVITVAFIGYLVAGLTGATLAAIGVFLPCYLLTILPAPYFRRIASNLQIKAFVDGVTAAATGAIAGAAFVLGKRAIIDIPTALIGLGTLAALVYARKLPEPLVIVTAGVIGFILKSLAGF